MTPANQPDEPDKFRSAVQTHHPRIADEIDVAIKTLNKLKEIAGPTGQPPSGADPIQGDVATIALTRIPDSLPDRTIEAGSQAYAQTEVESGTGDDVPLLAASSSFGRYQIVRTLGRGAMGAVYLAYDTQLHRHVALKTPFLGKSSLTIDRFYREARAAAQLRSPYLCPIYDVGKIGEVHYISMAFIDGHSLSQVMAARRLKTVGEITTIIVKVARGLQKAHDQGIVHRDLKPDNIMVDQEGEPIVMDFGLARRVNDDVQVTMPGVIVGTPAYMSPEQIDGDTSKLGPATDIYSLGTVLYHMLTGQVPFRGTLTSILNQVGTNPPVRPSAINAGIGQDSPLEQICLKMMAKSPADRHASMAEVIAALESLSGGQEMPAPTTSRVRRIKTWSSGVFASLTRSGKSPKETIASSQIVPKVDPNAATMADS
jgi:serine/threonine-protein kinase